MGNMLERQFWVGIGGPSCAGKSTLARRLLEQLPEGSARLLPLDAYYFDLSHVPFEERSGVNFDVPDALDWQLLKSHFDLLRQGEEVEIPVYDFAQHVRKAETQRVCPCPVMILEGLHALHVPFPCDKLQLKVYVDAPDTVCFMRRCQRDIVERGRTKESVIRQYETTVRPAAEVYVRSAKQRADLIVDGTRDEAIVIQIIGERIKDALGLLSASALDEGVSR